MLKFYALQIKQASVCKVRPIWVEPISIFSPSQYFCQGIPICFLGRYYAQLLIFTDILADIQVFEPIVSRYLADIHLADTDIADIHLADNQY
jgi:hypothetical protein